MSSNKLTDAEARQLLEMTKKSLVQEINFPTRGNEKEFDVVGDTKKDIFAIKIYRGKIQPFKYNIGARIKKNGTMLLELHISPLAYIHRRIWTQLCFSSRRCPRRCFCRQHDCFFNEV